LNYAAVPEKWIEFKIWVTDSLFSHDLSLSVGALPTRGMEEELIRRGALRVSSPMPSPMPQTSDTKLSRRAPKHRFKPMKHGTLEIDSSKQAFSTEDCLTSPRASVVPFKISSIESPRENVPVRSKLKNFSVYE